MKEKQIVINVPAMASVNLEKVKKVIKPLLVSGVIIGGICAIVWVIGGYLATNAALTYANLSRNQVSRISFDLDIDHFMPTYDIQWYMNAREHEYTVHALTGEILGMEID